LSPANDSSQASSAQSNFNLFEQLASSLQSGNLSAAQQAYTSLAASFQNSPRAQSTNPLSADFQALGQALQSGNLSAAQQAFSTLGRWRPASGAIEHQQSIG
jgi:outer membrane protein assembly factor BamD (BamD/ComL family)